jgi:hypothetical protein
MQMIEEEYRGYNLTSIQHAGMWQVSIYPLTIGQPAPKPERQMAQAVVLEDALFEARSRIDALIAGAM